MARTADQVGMQVGQFPASAANSLIQGYCDDFVALAAILAQTLEQVSMRGIDLKHSRPSLERIERGMQDLAAAIRELLDRPVGARAAPDAAPEAAKQPNDAKGSAAAAPPAPTPTSTPVTKPPPRAAASPAPAVADDDDFPRPAAMQAPAQKPAAVPVAPTAAKVGPAATGSRPKDTTAHVDMRPAELRNSTAPRTEAKADAKDERATAAPAVAGPPAPAAPPAAGRPVGHAPSNRPRAAATSQPRPSAATPPVARPGRMPAGGRPEGLKGTNQSMPLLSVFQFLGRMRKQGTMHVQLPDEALAFELENGCLFASVTDRCPREERLGELLVELDVCTREQLEPVIQQADAGSPDRFGQLVIQAGLANAEQIVHALEEQVRRRFTRACRHPEAAYEFHENERAAAVMTQFRIQPVAVG
jgi:hypothetical protein